MKWLIAGCGILTAVAAASCGEDDKPKDGEVGAYEGPLETGMYYQFRVKSWRQPGNGDAAPISAIEDLRGVFFKPAP
jgi:hypothetical protein